MKLPDFEYRRASSVADAVAILSQYGADARPVSGGQSLFPMMAFRLANPKVLVDLGALKELNEIKINGDGVFFGALVRWRDLIECEALKAKMPILAEAVPHIAHYQIRNRGTIGGSLANADPASELPAIAVTADARVEIAGPNGSRQIPAADLFLGPLTTSLAADEIITGLQFPPWPAGRKWAFEEFAAHRGAFALAGVALFYDEGAGGIVQNVHIGILGAASKPRRVIGAEAILEGKHPSVDLIAAAADQAAAEADPSDDFHASAAYRRGLLKTLIQRAFAKAQIS